MKEKERRRRVFKCGGQRATMQPSILLRMLPNGLARAFLITKRARIRILCTEPYKNP